MTQHQASRTGGPSPPDLLLLAVLAMLVLHEFAPIATLIAGPWRLAGALAVMVGVGLNIWADRLFKRAGVAVKPFEPSVALVVAGPFRFSRNPMYLGMVLALAGVAIGLGSASPWAVAAVFAWRITERFIVAEERDLEAAFGGQFLAYRAQVRRWI